MSLSHAGGKGLIERISRDSRVPVIKHLDGNCHVYIESDADFDKAVRVAINAKTQRYGLLHAGVITYRRRNCRSAFAFARRRIC